MHRFYLPDAPAGEGFECALSAEESQHAGRVLRLRAGDRVECFDGRGRAWLCELAFSGQQARVRALEPLPANESGLRVTLYQGMPKLDKLDLIVQKATELGAHRIVPVNMARSVARAEGKDAARKQERWQRIAMEAAKQCGRGRVPEILPAMSWKQALSRLREHELVIVPWEEARGMNLRALHERHPDARDLAIVIGPEGGISPEEIAEMAGEAVTLGPRILRTETAAVAAMTLAMSLWGDI